MNPTGVLRAKRIKAREKEGYASSQDPQRKEVGRRGLKDTPSENQYSLAPNEKAFLITIKKASTFTGVGGGI